MVKNKTTEIEIQKQQNLCNLKLVDKEKVLSKMNVLFT